MPFAYIAILIVSYAFAWFLLRKVRNLGTGKESKGQLRWSAQKVPTLGGLVLFVSFILSFIAGGNEGESVVSALPAFFIAFITGLRDDMRSISPRIKLLGQVAAAIVLVLLSDVGFFSLQSVIILVIMVGMMNSLNMLDNMDGVAAAVVLMFCSWSVAVGEIWPALMCIPGLLVFLYFNLKPARMYLGDGGSLFLGIFMGYVGIQHISEGEWGAVTPDLNMISGLFLMFCFPAADTLLVVVNRLLAGISPATGGRDHSTHHLVYAGVREAFIPWLYVLVASVPWILVHICGLTTLWALAYFAVVFGFLFVLSRKNISTGKFVYPS